MELVDEVSSRYVTNQQGKLRYWMSIMGCDIDGCMVVTKANAREQSLKDVIK